MVQSSAQKDRRVRLRLFTEADTIISINTDEDEDYQLAVGFQVTMSTTRQTNRANIQVAGLNRATRAQIAGVINGVTDLTNTFITLPGQDPPIVFGSTLFPSGIAKDETIRNGHAWVELDVGYSPEKMSRVFEGSSHWARHQKVGPLWTTQLDVGDGLSTRLGGVTSRTFDPGATLFEAVEYCVRSMGVGRGNLTRDTFKAAYGGNRSLTLPVGQTVEGDSVPALNALLAGSRVEWWIDRGDFWIVEKGKPLDSNPIEVALGLEGGLRFDPQPVEGGGVMLNMWLRPDARIGRRIRVDANILSGEYRLETVTHRGNNLQGDYQTVAIARKVETVPGVF